MATEPGGLLLVLMAAPHESETCSTALRLAREAVGAGYPVTVWTCGWATALTLRTLPAVKPRNFSDWEASYPSTATLVGDLLAAAGGRLRWLVCGWCAHHRGTAEQIDGVRLVPGTRFGRQLAAATQALFLGVT
jgi:sulfur relay (sulfurtransferase) complex TusBCD TusD component (DsrE family)